MARRGCVRLVAFDLDDTLWSTARVIGRAVEKWYKHLGIIAPRMTARFSMEDLAARSKSLLTEHPELKHDLTKVRLRVTEEACVESGMEAGDIPAKAFAEFIRWRSEVDDLSSLLIKHKAPTLLSSNLNILIGP